MSLGKFVGLRLRDARLARGLTSSLLAERVGVTPGAISQLERHDSVPRAQTLTRLSEVLELPEAYFLRPMLPPDNSPALYRSRAAATKKSRFSTEARHGWLREIVAAVDSFVELPQVDLGEVFASPDPNAISDNDIENAASQVRQTWNLGDGPIPNVVRLLEARGCVVSSFAFGAETQSALSRASADRPYVLLNAEEEASGRRRFNAAHELFHLIGHRAVPDALASQPAIHKLMERQAHRFASAFLFPANSFAEEVYSLSLDSLVQVKSRWKVSIQMIVHRARTLGMISQDVYERAFRDLSRRGYRTREPLDDKLEVEAPALLADALRLMLDEHATTREDLLHRLPFFPGDIEVLAGLPRGYLSTDSWGKVAELKLRTKAAVPSLTDSGAQVLQFRAKPKQ